MRRRCVEYSGAVQCVLCGGDLGECRGMGLQQLGVHRLENTPPPPSRYHPISSCYHGFERLSQCDEKGATYRASQVDIDVLYSIDTDRHNIGLLHSDIDTACHRDSSKSCRY